MRFGKRAWKQCIRRNNLPYSYVLASGALEFDFQDANQKSSDGLMA